MPGVQYPLAYVVQCLKASVELCSVSTQNCRITESPKLEGAHWDHWVLLLAPHRTTQTLNHYSECVCRRNLPKTHPPTQAWGELMLTHPGGSIPGLGNSSSVSAMVWAESRVIQRCHSLPWEQVGRLPLLCCWHNSHRVSWHVGFLLHGLSPSDSGLSKWGRPRVLVHRGGHICSTSEREPACGKQGKSRRRHVLLKNGRYWYRWETVLTEGSPRARPRLPTRAHSYTSLLPSPRPLPKAAYRA